MKYFETFNFDIVIVLIILASIISGMYFGFYRQLRKSLVILGPFIILFFIFNYINSLTKSITFLQNILNSSFGFIAKILGMNAYQNTVMTFFIGLIFYILFALVIRVLYSAFPVSQYKRVLHKPSKLSKLVAGILSLINAYIIIIVLIYAMKPVTDLNNNLLLTKLINESSNEVIVISKLNYYQNVNVEKHSKFEDALAHLTGEKAVSEYNELMNFFGSLDDLNTEFKDVLVPSFSDASKNLITANLENDDYINCLLKEVNGKVLYKTVVGLEKSHEQIASIKEKYNYLMNNRGYYFMLTNYLVDPFNTYTVFDIYDIMNTNKTEISNAFIDLKVRNQFLNRLNTFENFVNHFEDYKLMVDETIDNVDSYVEKFSLMINDKDQFEVFIAAFRENYPLSNLTINSIAYNIHECFNEYLKVSEKTSELNQYMSLSLKIVLSKNLSDFEKDINSLNPLLKSYIIDMIINQNAKGFDLYHEYFFFRYLTEELSFADELDLADMQKVLTNLKKTVDNNILTAEQAKTYFANLFLNSKSVIYDLQKQNKLSTTLFDDLAGITDEYITDELKIVLGNL